MCVTDHYDMTLAAKVALNPNKTNESSLLGGFRKKSCVSTGVRKPGNTCASLTTMI